VCALRSKLIDQAHSPFARSLELAVEEVLCSRVGLSAAGRLRTSFHEEALRLIHEPASGAAQATRSGMGG
jgi:hypothetical protein